MDSEVMVILMVLAVALVGITILYVHEQNPPIQSYMVFNSWMENYGGSSEPSVGGRGRRWIEDVG